MRCSDIGLVKTLQPRNVPSSLAQSNQIRLITDHSDFLTFKMAAVALPLAPAPTRADSPAALSQGLSLPEHLRRSIQGGFPPQTPAQGAYGQPEEVQGVSNFRQYEPPDSAARRTSAPVPIPSATSAMNSRNGSGSSQSTQNLGPLSRTVTIPDRPKPGRKPLAQEDAQDRRRVQNRLAQRNFRDKRAQKVSELTVDNDNLRRKMDQMMGDYERQLAIQKDKMRELQNQIDRLTREMEQRERQAHAQELANTLNAGFSAATLTSGTPSTHLPTGYAASTNGIGSSGQNMAPPTDDLATDMSSAWRSSSRPNNALNRPQSSGDNDTNWLNGDMQVDNQDRCGFCDGSSSCPCRESQRQEVVTQAPGTCEKCQQDPEQARRCQALAAQTSFETQQSSRNDSMAGMPTTMSCSDFMEQMGAENGQLPSITELFAGPMHAYPSTHGSGGYDINEQEAAQVLQSLSSRRNTVAADEAA